MKPTRKILTDFKEGIIDIDAAEGKLDFLIMSFDCQKEKDVSKKKWR